MQARLSRKPCLECLEERRVLATFVVDDPADYAPAAIDFFDEMISLREAVLLAEDQDDVDLIKFDPTVFGSGPGLEATIELLHGELVITNPVILDGNEPTLISNELIPGPGWEGLTIDASMATGNTSAFGDGSRIFNIQLGQSNQEVEIRGLTLTGGDVDGDGGAVLGSFPSAGTSNGRRLWIDQVLIHDNIATAKGGGLSVEGAGLVELT